MKNTPTRVTRFCGIDVHKAKHVACVIDRDGKFLIRSHSVHNNAVGFGQLLRRLGQVGNTQDVLVAMEATGHYWYSLHDFLQRHAYDVVVLNPIQTHAQARKGIRKTRTDKIDAHHIATLIKNGEHRPTHVPGEPAMTCRQLSRLWYSLVRQRSRIKQLIRSRLHPAWPEYETFFADPFCPSSRAVLKAAPTPQDLLALGPDQLTLLLRKTSRGKLGSARAERIRKVTETSVGMRRGLEGIRIGIRTLLAELDAFRPVQQALREDIENHAAQLPPYVLTLPGADSVRAVSLFGETDPIEAFGRPGQLVAFAGLDPGVHQSGQGAATYRRISKRGSPFLRRTIWTMANLAVRTEGDLRTYYLRRRRDGLHYLSAVTATAIKLCRIAWRILTDRRDYLPDARQIQS